MDDVEVLARYFLQRLGRNLKHDWTHSLSDAIRKRVWRGNVRELRNAMEHAAVLARGRPITAMDLPEEQRPLEDDAAASVNESTLMESAAN